jgi:hypothetical protein
MFLPGCVIKRSILKAERPPASTVIALAVTVDGATFEASETDARNDGIPVERFVANNLRKCVEAGGHPV